MAVDLTAARRQITRVMDSQCRVVRDPQGKLDDTLDLTTFELVPEPNDKSNIYAGPCMVIHTGDRQVKVKIPFEAPRVTEGDRVIVLDSADPRLRGRLFEVREVVRSSFPVARTMVCADISAPEVT